MASVTHSLTVCELHSTDGKAHRNYELASDTRDHKIVREDTRGMSLGHASLVWNTR